MAPKFFVFYFIKDIPQNLAKVDEILWYNEHRGREMRDMNDILKDFLEELIDIILVCD